MNWNVFWNSAIIGKFCLLFERQFNNDVILSCGEVNKLGQINNLFCSSIRKNEKLMKKIPFDVFCGLSPLNISKKVENSKLFKINEFSNKIPMTAPQN